ncbi:TolC family protein [Gemmatimonadota bacterium]
MPVRQHIRALAVILSIPCALIALTSIAVAQQGEGGLPDFNTQEVLTLNVNLAVQIAQDRSYRMEQASYGLIRSRLNLEASRAALKSNASMNFILPDYDQSIKEVLDNSTGKPKVLSTSGARYSTSVTIRQPLPTDGMLSLSGVWNRTSDQLFTYSPGEKNYYSRLLLNFTQPILQPNEIKNNIRRAELRLEESELGFRDEEIRLATQVSQSFYELFELTHQDMIAAGEAERLTNIYQTGQQLFTDELISEVNLLQLEVNYATSQNEASANAGRLAREKDDFKQEIGLPADTEIEIDASMEYTSEMIDLDAMVERAFSERSDLRGTLRRREQEEMELRETRAQGRLTGDISLTLGLEGRGEEMAELYDAILDPDQARGASIKFQLPLWDWGRNTAQVKSKESELDQNYRTEEEQIRTIRREVENVIARVEEAESRLLLLEPSVEASLRSFSLAMEQFTAGSLNVQDILLTQDQVSDAHSSYLGAFLDYQRALIDLRAVTTGSGYGGRFNVGR